MLAAASPERFVHGPKVFWFFFSKKNILAYVIGPQYFTLPVGAALLYVTSWFGPPIGAGRVDDAQNTIDLMNGFGVGVNTKRTSATSCGAMVMVKAPNRAGVAIGETM